MENKKKVLVFIPEFPVLTETFIERELDKLVERDKVDLVVFSLKKGAGKISDTLKPKVFYERLGVADVPGIIIYVLSHFSEVLKMFRDAKNEHVSVSFYVFFKSIGYARKFSRFKPDLILAHFLSEPSTIAMYASKIAKIPYAISAHARDIMITSERVKEKVNTAKFITICNKNAYELQRKRI